MINDFVRVFFVDFGDVIFGLIFRRVFRGGGLIILPAHMFCVASHILLIDSSVKLEIWWGSGIQVLGGINLLEMGLGSIFLVWG